MPSRKDIFLDREIYHIYNKTIDNKEIFKTPQLPLEFLARIKYYRSAKANLRYSFFLDLPVNEKNQREMEIEDSFFFDVDILQYCIMSNHFHLLVKQRSTNGIRRLLSNSINSFTRYYNGLNDRKGPLFLTQFQSKHVMNDEYLLTISRYIHLNPYDANVVRNWDELVRYKYSSLNEYIARKKRGDFQLTNSSVILRYFQYNKNKYRAYLLNEVDK